MYTTWWVFTKWTPTSICYIYNILYLKDIGEDHLAFPMTLIYLGYLWKYPSFVYTIIISWVTDPFGRSFPCKRLLAWSKGRQLDSIAQLTSGWETTTTHLIQSDVHVGLCFCPKLIPQWHCILSRSPCSCTTRREREECICWEWRHSKLLTFLLHSIIIYFQTASLL